MLKIQKNKLIILMPLCAQLLFGITLKLYEVELSYSQMSILEIGQTCINIILLKAICKLPIISIPNLFLAFSMLFHCGQIIKKGFGIAGSVPLPFENYADISVIQNAFYFYVFFQTFLAIAIGMTAVSKRETFAVPERWNRRAQVDASVYGKVLLIIGLIPRMYIDILSLLGAATGGYEGVYSLYIPQMVQSLGFFFDAGLLFLLFGTELRKKRRALFIIVIVYKCIMMATGARQEKVAFLLIWFYVYFFILNRITIKKLLLLVVACIVGFMFISAIGTIRAGDTVNLSQVLKLLTSGTMTNVLGGALGEFGSAFNTLEVAMQYTPSHIAYGYGRSYIAGCLSVIPVLVSKIPPLAESVVFLEQLPRTITFAFGGSYLGELYYNFGWFGVLGSCVLGAVLARIHNVLVPGNCDSTGYKSWCAILATAMLLFVRGYFTDMIQKLVWTYIIIQIVQMHMIKQGARKDKQC